MHLQSGSIFQPAMLVYPECTTVRLLWYVLLPLVCPNHHFFTLTPENERTSPWRETTFKRDVHLPTIHFQKNMLVLKGLPSLKLTLYTWKLRIGSWFSFWKGFLVLCHVTFRGLRYFFFFSQDSTPEVGEGDLGIGIGGKVLTGLFLQVQDLRNAGDDDVPKN